MKNSGKWQNRFDKNPLEKKFAEAWEDANDWHDLYSDILNNDTDSSKVVSDHDRETVSTVIQWLGSPHGVTFIYNALKLSEFNGVKDLSRHILQISKESKRKDESA